MILFHRSMFAVILIVCFVQGALDARRQNIIDRIDISYLINMSLADLSKIETIKSRL